MIVAVQRILVLATVLLVAPGPESDPPPPSARTANGTAEVRITRQWLQRQGAAPYYLSQPGTRYVLETDVVVRGTAFVVIADNVTLDLAGHSVFYDHARPVEVKNGSFETDEAWDFSAAPGAERFAGEFLKNQVFDGEYSLKLDEDGFVESTGSVTLQHNTTYALSAMIQSHGQGTGFVQLVAGEEVVHEAAWGDENWRGIQHQETVFRTGPDLETCRVRVGVRDASGPCFVDDVRICRYQAFGVFAGPQDWAPDDCPDTSRYGTGNGFRLIGNGGRICQGADAGQKCHAVSFRRAADMQIEGVALRVAGPETSCLRVPEDAVIRGCQLTSHTRVNGHRDSLLGAVLEGGREITGNQVTGGMQTGIKAGKGAVVANNRISIRSWYTNGFAINGGHRIVGNTIDNVSGDFGGRGIAPSAGTPDDPALVTGNTIRVCERMRNQEYGGAVMGGAYGIQIEKTGNIRVTNNTVEARAVDGVEAHAVRIGGSGGGSTGIEVSSNTIVANSDGQQGSWADCVKLSDGIEFGDLDFHDNTWQTNDGFALTAKGVRQEFVRSLIELQQPVRTWNDHVYPYASGWDGQDWSGLSAELVFVDPRGDVEYLEGEYRTERRYGFKPTERGVVRFRRTGVTNDGGEE